MKTYLYIIPCLLLSLSAAGQEVSPDEGNTKKTVIRLNILGVPGLGFETSLGRSFTIRPEAGLGWPVFTASFDAEGNNDVDLVSWVNPYLLLEARYYYNLNRRIERAKRTAYFGADYISLYYRYNAYEYQADFVQDGDDDSRLVRDVQSMGFWWGMQRNMGPRQRFYINWSLGPGIKTNWIDYGEASFTGQLGLGVQW
jgi:hypothetical protein